MNVLIIILELSIIFLTSRIISKVIFTLGHKVTRSQELASRFFAFIFFPGTLLHELAHFLMAKILFVNAGKIEFTPILDSNGLKLGSVQIERTDYFRRFLIGVAPLLIGSGILILILYYFTQWVSFDTLFDSTKNIIIFILSLYSVFVITNTMFSSKKDMEGAFGLGTFIVFVLTVVFVAGKGDWIVDGASQLLQNDEIQNVLQRILILLSVPLTTNILFVSIFFLLKGRK